MKRITALIPFILVLFVVCCYAENACDGVLEKLGAEAKPKEKYLPAAVLENDTESVCLLLKTGGNVNQKHKCVHFHGAVRNSSFADVKHFVTNCDVPLGIPSFTAARCCIWPCSKTTWRWLSCCCKRTPTSTARRSTFRTHRFLHHLFCSVPRVVCNCFISDDSTALHVAAGMNHIPMVKLLLRFGAKVNSLDKRCVPVDAAVARTHCLLSAATRLWTGPSCTTTGRW